MLKSHVKRSFLVATVITMGLATVLSANHSWGPYHWARTSDPFTLKVGDNVSSAWDGYLDEAISDWNVSTMLDLTKVAGGTKPKSCRPTTGRIEACSASYGGTGWLGIAQIWITGGEHITQAITKVNDFYFDKPTYNKPEWRRLVMCQEIAHDFGLTHQDENFDNPNLGSCMDYTSNPLGPPSNEHPNAHDYNELVTIYTHLDSVSTLGASKLPSAMPPAMGQIEFDTPGQWGRLVHSGGRGRVEVYELDFGRGNRVVTHVLWADPEADAQ